MTGAEFLEALRRAFGGLNDDEIERRVTYYREMLLDMTEDGMSEEEAVAKLGDPQEIARTVAEEMPMMTLVKAKMRPKHGWTPGMILLVALGSPLWFSLLMTLVLAALSIWIALWAVAASLVITFVATAIIGAAAILLSLWRMPGHFPDALMLLGFGLIAGGIGLALSATVKPIILGMARLSRATFVGTKRMLMK